MQLYKLAINNIIAQTNQLVNIDNRIDGAEDVLISAINNNKANLNTYKYNQFPQIISIVNKISPENNKIDSLEFARNVFKYQVSVMGLSENSADGVFDPEFIQNFATKNNIDLKSVFFKWQTMLGKNYLGNRWVGRRQQEEKGELQGGFYHFPMKSAKIVGDFTGARPSDENHKLGHFGTDFSAAKGTPIFPIAPGVVKSAGNLDKNAGIGVIIDHENKVVSLYKHMDSVNVKPGDTVEYNTVLGGCGDSGNAKNRGYHLHLEIKINGSYVDPMSVLGKPIK